MTKIFIMTSLIGWIVFTYANKPYLAVFNEGVFLLWLVEYLKEKN